MSRRFLLYAGLCGLIMLCAACQQPVAPGTPTPVPAPVIPTRIPQTDNAQPGTGSAQPGADNTQPGTNNADPWVVNEQLWKSSQHAATFVTDDDGSNNVCARCHAPHNWLPTDPADMPETCASCKFTIKTPKPVAKEAWKAIPCEVCHRVENNTLTEKRAFLNTAISQFETDTDPYENVGTNKELCAKCHVDRGGFSYGIDLGTGPHSTFDCTKCHNPHSPTASCTAEGCHAGILTPPEPIEGHDADHESVSCIACHDAAGLQVGPTEGDKNWTTWRNQAPGGKTKLVPFVSHKRQREVDCARCHFPKNPWGIAESAEKQ